MNDIKALFKKSKEKYPDAIALFRHNDFYSAFEQDADIVARVCGTRHTNEFIPFKKCTRFPFHCLDIYLPKLIRAGYRIAIYDYP